MMLIGLDLGSAAGLAWGDSSDAKPRCATWTLTGHHGARFAAMTTKLSRLIDDLKPEVIGFEAPIAAGVKGGQERVQLAMGWRTLLLLVAYRKGVRCEEIAVQSARKVFLGDGKAKKPAVAAHCHAIGWPAATHDEADACAIWATLRHRVAGVSMMPPGLFG